MSSMLSAVPAAPPRTVETARRIDPAVAEAIRAGLTDSPKWLPAWLFYNAEGSRLFEQITTLPEYYLTRTERGIFTQHADSIVAGAIDAAGETGSAAGRLRLIELGAGSASKTGILLEAAVRRQGATDYLPIDVSATALDEACSSIQRNLPEISVRPQIANYVTDSISIPLHDGPTLALYIGSSIGNFAPDEAHAILCNLRAQLRAGDTLLLGTDLVKDTDVLLSAYDDAAGVTAAFNMNLLTRMNQEAGANFDPHAFRHWAVWNAEASRIEMHLRSERAQHVDLPALGLQVTFAEGETIHTENSCKFTQRSISALLQAAGYKAAQNWTDDKEWFAVTLAVAV